MRIGYGCQTYNDGRGLLSCGSGADEAARAVDALPPIYPDYAGVTVPCNIAPLNFKIRGAERIRAEFVAGGEARFVAEGRKGAIEIPPKKWRALLADADVAEVRVSAWSAAEPEGVRYAPFRIIVSPEPIDERIAYRLMEPGYEGWLQMGIYQRDLTNFDEDVLVDNSVNSTGCVNCHSFRDYSPDEMLFHARGKSGGTVFVRDGRMKKVDLASTPPSVRVYIPCGIRADAMWPFRPTTRRNHSSADTGSPLRFTTRVPI